MSSRCPRPGIGVDANCAPGSHTRPVRLRARPGAGNTTKLVSPHRCSSNGVATRGCAEGPGERGGDPFLSTRCTHARSPCPQSPAAGPRARTHAITCSRPAFPSSPDRLRQWRTVGIVLRYAELAARATNRRRWTRGPQPVTQRYVLHNGRRPRVPVHRRARLGTHDVDYYTYRVSLPGAGRDPRSVFVQFCDGFLPSPAQDESLGRKRLGGTRQNSVENIHKR